MGTKQISRILVTWLLVSWITTTAYTQDTLDTPYIKYTFKIEGIDEYREAKPIWDDIRYFFNDTNNPFKYRVDLNELGEFSIVILRDLSEFEIREYFNSKNIVLTELNKLYYE
jgi:hypothetical protein